MNMQDERQIICNEIRQAFLEEDANIRIAAYDKANEEKFEAKKAEKYSQLASDCYSAPITQKSNMQKEGLAPFSNKTILINPAKARKLRIHFQNMCRYYQKNGERPNINFL